MSKDQFKQMEIAHDICTAPTVNDALKIWTANAHELEGCKFIYATRGDITLGVNVNRDFEGGGFLRSMFGKERLFFIDEKTISQMNRNGKVDVPIDYSIMFETNAASYIESKMSGSRKEIIKLFTEILNEIIEKNINFDYIIYCAENVKNIKDSESAKRVYDKLLALEIFRCLDGNYYLKTGEMRPKLPMGEIVKNVTEKMSSLFYQNETAKENRFDVMYRTYYCILLKIALIHFTNRQNEVAKKVEQLCDFMHNQMHCMFQRELMVGVRFFERGTSLSFFGRIHKDKGSKTISNILKNMAWDFTAIRMVEGMSTYTADGGRYFLPLLLTFDRRQKEIYDIYPLKACAYLENGLIPYPFPEYDVIEELRKVCGNDSVFIEKYFDRSEAKKRQIERERSKIDLTTIIENFETELKGVLR